MRMKKITLLVSTLCLAVGVNAQILSENFDSYSSGDYLGVVGAPDWTTWSAAPGSSEDVQIGTAQANSGANSTYFLGTTGGGPQDVVLEFDQLYTSGTFIFETAVYVDANKSAYFNFQATQVIGTTWAMNCNMDGGIISIDDGVTSDLALGNYTDDTWFTLRIEANLSTGRWQAFVDGTCIGVWANSINSLASLDIFPLDNSSFYMDDVMYDYIAYTPVALNATVAGFSIGGNIAGLDVHPKVTINNSGTTTITSFDVTVDYDGTPYVENITGVNLTAGQSMEVVYTNPITLVTGNTSATATVSNINGGTDDDVSDNDGCLVSNPVVPAPGKVVVGEEATGTWCTWCPRGTVYMDKYKEDFGPFWAGIAVHNGDPMANSVYDAGVGTMISGYPSSLVDRNPEVDPSAMSTDFYARLQIAPTAIITNAYTWNATTRVLEVTVTADFQMAADNNYKLACVITEDGVTGTGSGYDQVNAYAGGSNGVMGGFEVLPNPVPASQMVYDHVARGIEPSFEGDASSFPAVVNVGEQHSRTYSFTLDAGWNENNMEIIGMIIAPNGMIDNAGKTTVVVPAGINEIDEAASFKLYPNPATTSATVELALENDSKVELTVYDMSGKEIASRNYGVISNSTLQINTVNFEAGVYLVEVTVNGIVSTKRLIIQ